MVFSENPDKRKRVSEILGEEFSRLENKIRAWEYLERLTQDQDSYVRGSAADSLGLAFQLVHNKKRAWEYLHRLTQDQDSYVRGRAAYSLGLAFPHVHNKKKAWEDLHRLTQDEVSYVRWRAAYSLGSAFPLVHDKEQAWMDLIRLNQDQVSSVRGRAAGSLGSAFPHVPDKEQAWKDLHRLTQDRDSYVRGRAADSLGLAFQLVHDKKQAWKDLHELTQDQDSFVRLGTAGSLGSAFQHVPDKEQAWMDLTRLAQDYRPEVRCVCNHSLGRASILKATEDDDKFRVHLEGAIEFFRRSSEDARYYNPAAFCYPFYRSLHSLLFTEVSVEEEVRIYLAEAEMAVEASESREVLLEAVNNLSKALQEVRTYSVEDIALHKRDLKSYTRYCLQAADCLKEVRKKTPLASKIIDFALIEKSLPIIDQKIKILFREVEDATKRLCKNTKGTKLEALGRIAYKSTTGLGDVDSPIVADRYLEEIVPLLKANCSRLPTDAQTYLKTLIESQDTATLEQRFETLKSVLLATLIQGGNDDRRVKELKDLMSLHFKNIEFAISKLNVDSGNARKDLFDIKSQIDILQKEMDTKGLSKKELFDTLDEKDKAMIERLNKMREEILKSLKDVVKLNAKEEDVNAILKTLDDQDRLKARDALGIIADISSLAAMGLSILMTGSLY